MGGVDLFATSWLMMFVAVATAIGNNKINNTQNPHFEGYIKLYMKIAIYL